MPTLRMCVPANVQMRNSSGFHFFCLALTLRIPQVLASKDTPEQISQANALLYKLCSSVFSLIVDRGAPIAWDL
ncbi:hypothetical protein chiPu_0022841 [Chiloscyllium punctatum]|uniref:Uncharacterized protein n=1 Tax=Chiloscyllium punctatum TaxID=137246 RepID=A0A401T9D6_CHIPU|nr:hypothetical protein [Chiloscyllium punctatum]